MLSNYRSNIVPRKQTASNKKNICNIASDFLIPSGKIFFIAVILRKRSMKYNTVWSRIQGTKFKGGCRTLLQLFIVQECIVPSDAQAGEITV